ncbi:hypothetical protein E2C01_040343 [Portunus trituberculatus]|uniref:Uncharacterized protein n=1 Tax=Portunus trituberculatus TaxID=210409 RepID=A0A5B7FG99_PORTR|nr:hypothetical protein [Portunus trituberculatus]
MVRLAAVEQRELESSQRLLVAWLPQLGASGLRLVGLLVPDALHWLRLLRFRPILLLSLESSVAALGAIGALARDAVEVPLQVGACLQRHWQEWENIGACEYPPLSSVPVEFPVYREGLNHHSALEAAVSEMLIKGAIELVVDPLAGFYSRVFLVPKSTGGWRPICDLSVLNCFLVVNWAKPDLSPSQRKQFFGYGSRHRQSLSLPVARLGQPISGSCPTVSASQGSTNVPLEIFAGTSCVPSTVLQSFQQALLGSVVSVMSENSTVVAYLRRSGGTCSKPLLTLAGTVLRWCKSCSISLCPVFVPGRHNVIADVLSRECVGSEWTLHPAPLWSLVHLVCLGYLPGTFLWSFGPCYVLLMSFCSLSDISLKTVFLLAFASARQVSGLHGLSSELCHSKGWTSMTISFTPNFLAKTQCPGQHSFDEFTIPALLDFVGEDEVDRLLCPVWVVCEYLRRTGDCRLACFRFRIPDELSTLIPCLSGFVR